MKMQRKAFEDILKQVEGVEVFYDHTTSEDRASLPFIVYLDEPSNNIFADNRTYVEKENFSVHIFTMSRDEDLESDLKKLLNENHVPYNLVDVDFDEDNLLWEVTYYCYL